MKQRMMFSRGRQLKVARQTLVDATKEEMIVKQIQQGLSAHGIPNFRIRERIPVCHKCGNRTAPSPAGNPDLAGWVPARFLNRGRFGHELAGVGDIKAIPLFIECKRPSGGVETLVQKAFLDQARKDGSIAMFARGWDDVVRVFAEHGIKLAA